MLQEIFLQVIYFLNLTLTREVMWTIYPLALATIITLIYFEKYTEEKPGWNTYVANSLVLIFISSIAFNHFFSLNGQGLMNIVLFPLKFAAASITFILGIVILLVNFKHILPEKIARKISSPLTLNIFAYIVILFVYSELPENIIVFFSLLIIFLMLIIILNILRVIFKKIFTRIEKMKKKEKVEDVKEKKEEIEKEKNKLKSEEKKVKKAELEKVKKQKNELKKVEKVSKKL
ncbi:hypothetical protein K9L16_01270 [Candidatus Pacearchaeota archaeon]|nr:hypothetical protein [Candidatus Pacearchaeota archaeon]